MREHTDRFQHGLDVYDGMTANMFESRLNPGLAELEKPACNDSYMRKLLVG